MVAPPLYLALVLAWYQSFLTLQCREFGAIAQLTEPASRLLVPLLVMMLTTPPTERPNSSTKAETGCDLCLLDRGSRRATARRQDPSEVYNQKIVD